MKKSGTVLITSLLILSIIAVSFILADGNSIAAISNTSITPKNNITQNSTSTHDTNSSTREDHVIKNVTNRTSPNPTPLGSAEKEQEDIRTSQIKTSQYFSQEATCRINFNIGVLNAFISAFPNSSAQLQPTLTNLQNDLSQVQSIGNTSEIHNFVEGQYSNDVKDATSHLPTRELKNISLDQRAALISSYNQLKTVFDQCEKSGYVNISQGRLNSYQIQISSFQNKSDNLASKGFNTSSLNQLLQDAQTQIITPLQNALSSATTAQQVQTAVRTYCLFDGCINGTNFHLEAKFDTTRLSIVLADLQNNSAALHLDNTTLAQAQQYLSEAQSTLNSVGTAVYQNGQSQTIFSDIQKASKDIVQLMNQALHIIK